MSNKFQMPKSLPAPRLRQAGKTVFDIFPPHYYKVYSGRDPAEVVRILDLICH